jgi:hypothetical protein
VQSGNTWGLCPTCDGWFHCPEWFDRFAPQPVCPACGAEPDAIVVRDESPAAAAVPTRIEGQCPSCGRWFNADSWFDDAAPVPCCPGCDMVPAKLAYVHGSGKRVERLLTVDLVASGQWRG